MAGCSLEYLVDFVDGPSAIVPEERARPRARVRSGRARARVILPTSLNVRKIFIILYNITTLHEELLFTTPVPGICATSTFPQSESPPSLHLPSYCLSSRDCLSLHPDRQHLLTDRYLSNRYVRRDPRLHSSEVMEPLHRFDRGKCRDRSQSRITIPFLPIQPGRFFTDKSINEFIVKGGHGEDLDCIFS